MLNILQVRAFIYARNAPGLQKRKAASTAPSLSESTTCTSRTRLRRNFSKIGKSLIIRRTKWVRYARINRTCSLTNQRATGAGAVNSPLLSVVHASSGAHSTATVSCFSPTWTILRLERAISTFGPQPPRRLCHLANSQHLPSPACSLPVSACRGRQPFRQWLLEREIGYPRENR